MDGWNQKQRQLHQITCLILVSRFKISDPCNTKTEIFFKLRGNRFVRAEPTELHFHIVAREKDRPLSYKKRIWLINIAAKSTRVNFIPPQTKWFTLFFSTPVRKSVCEYQGTFGEVIRVGFSPILTNEIHGYSAIFITISCKFATS